MEIRLEVLLLLYMLFYKYTLRTEFDLDYFLRLSEWRLGTASPVP